MRLSLWASHSLTAGRSVVFVFCHLLYHGSEDITIIPSGVAFISTVSFQLGNNLSHNIIRLFILCLFSRY
uniref:Secreted protein n=1 Tax=Eptatretus burgeri TaxID=7764 RepID=A0A8C4R8K2_EPTBU